MPRIPRIQFKGAFYHVFNRGNRRERIFLDARDYARFERMLFEAVIASNIRLHRWSLLPNHFHLLVETPEGNLAEFMSRLLTRYAMYFNWRHKLVGHVFQGRYGSRVCDKEAYYLELIRYIELNPYRSKARNGAPLGTWKWSSHRYFMRPSEEWPPLLRQTFQEQMDRFSQDPSKARQAYTRFLVDGLSEGRWEDFYSTGNGHCLGDDTFTQEIHLKRQDPPPIETSYRDLSPTKLLDEVIRLSRCAEELLAGPSQERRLSRWRQAFVYVGRRFYRFPLKTLTKLIGRKSPAGSEMLRRPVCSGERDSELNRLMEAIAKPKNNDL